MPEPSRSPHGRALTAAAVVFFLLGLVVMAWNITLPLIAYSPGPVADAADAVIVEEVPVQPSAGELMMLTVAGQDINLFEALIAAADPTVDVIARQAVRRPDETDEDFRRRNLQLMDQSTATAITVALSRVDTSGYVPGVFITGYAADTPAGQVLEIGDRIVSLGGRLIAQTDDLADAMGDMAPGDVLAIHVARDGQVLDFEVELVAHEEEDRPIIGIFVRQLPFWVAIDSGIVGGPSAGLMYSLAIIDALSPDSLAGGRVVAGTGTVDEAGNVGPVGGVRQKVVAAEAAGADVMLVPEANFETAMGAPRDDLELVAIATVDEALEYLRSRSEA